MGEVYESRSEGGNTQGSGEPQIMLWSDRAARLTLQYLNRMISQTATFSMIIDRVARLSNGELSPDDIRRGITELIYRTADQTLAVKRKLYPEKGENDDS